MISRWRIITLSSLCLISTIACGFSAWVSTPYSDVSIDVEVGEVVSSEYAKHKSTTGTPYASYGFYHEDILADTTNHSYYDYNATIKSSWSLNLSKMGTNSVSLLFSIQSNVTFDFSKVTKNISPLQILKKAVHTLIVLCFLLLHQQVSLLEQRILQLFFLALLILLHTHHYIVRHKSITDTAVRLD